MKMELSFSQRHNYSLVKQAFLTDSINDELKNGLWNVLAENYFRRPGYKRHYETEKGLEELIYSLWRNFFKLPIDSIMYGTSDNLEFIREYFFNEETPWYSVYDFIEFIACNGNQFMQRADTFSRRWIDIGGQVSCEFHKDCNDILSREFSGYRLIKGKITPITNDIEVCEIESALDSSVKAKLDSAEHLSRSLELLSDKTNPDYRNSIKESISAVESVASQLSGNKKAKLKDALDKLDKELDVPLHGALKAGFLQIYGYTSDSNGIRHGLMDKVSLGFEDAKFMLVACSAFVNYLIEKEAQVNTK